MAEETLSDGTKEPLVHELAAELEAAGFAAVRLIGIEGPARLLPDVDRWWADPHRQAHLLRLARTFEDGPSLLGMNPHIMAVAAKPGA